MAEFLVFIRNRSVTTDSGNWMDQPGEYERLCLRIDHPSILNKGRFLTKEQKLKAKEKLAAKFEAVARPGDIIDCRPDGYFCEPEEKTGHGWDHYSFALLKCPNINYHEAKKYKTSWITRNEKGEITVRRKHRYSVEILNLIAGETRVISNLIDFIMDKANGGT